MNIGVLPVQISATFLAEIFEAIEKDPEAEIEVNLSEQKLLYCQQVLLNRLILVDIKSRI